MKRTFMLSGCVALLVCVSGFDFSKSNIPVDKIMGGGPPKDGIPAILDPRFIPAEEALFLEDHDQLIGVVAHGVAKAYPLKILTWHEVVNDKLGDKPVAVTY